MGLAAMAPARAADMVLKVPPPPPANPPSWTGLYFGANAGLGFGHSRFYDIYGPAPDYALDADPKLFGAVGGLQLGYNYQLNWLVLGLQGGFEWAGIQQHFSCFSFGNQTCSQNTGWIATITGRAGIAFDRTLLYVDGGPAWASDTISNIAGTAACVPIGGGPPVCSAPGDLFVGTDIRDGWTIGGGVEYMLSPNWAVDLHYAYFDFGQRPITLVDGGTGIFPESVKEEFQLITLGLDYRLTGPTAEAASSPWFFGTNADEASGRTIRAFSSFDVGKESVDGTIGGYFAFSHDLDTSGPRLWVTAGSGWYQYPATGAGSIRGVYTTADFLGGYAFEGDNYEVNLLAGPSVENDMLSGYDPDNPVQGTAVGAKVRGDMYYNPTKMSLFYGEAEYSTAFQTYWTSATYGYDVFNKGFFVGPEVGAFGDARFDQWRVGLRLSALKYGRLTTDISAGYAHDDVVGDGAYGHVEFSASF